MDSLHSPAESGPYDTFISNKMPAWVKHTVADDIKRLKPGLFPGYTAPADADNRFARAPSWQIQALLASQLRSRAANRRRWLWRSGICRASPSLPSRACRRPCRAIRARAGQWTSTVTACFICAVTDRAPATDPAAGGIVELRG